jgi:hypothetical protein
MALRGEGALGNVPWPQGIKFLLSGSPNSSNSTASLFLRHVYTCKISPVLNYVIKHHGMKIYGGIVEALDGVEWSVSRTCRYNSEGRIPRTPWTGGCVGPRAGPDTVEETKYLLPLSGTEFWSSSP